MTRCAHRWIPLAQAPFQLRLGAAWVMDYCHTCGARHWMVRNPHRHEPIAVDQPTPPQETPAHA